MISDAELLKLVMERYPEQPTPFIIEQFTVLKAGLIQANNKLAAMDMEEPVCEQVIIEEPFCPTGFPWMNTRSCADTYRSRSLSAKICWKNCRKTCRRPSGPESRSCPANT